MSLLQGASDKGAIKSASWALANLAKSNSDNKAAIREAKGIQVSCLYASCTSTDCNPGDGKKDGLHGAEPFVGS